MDVLQLLFINFYVILQLWVLSPTKTVPVKTIFLFFILGAFSTTFVTFWFHFVATRFFVFDIVSYTINPFVEETVKILPVFIIIFFHRAGRTMGILDAMLLALACGTGFEVAENSLYLLSKTYSNIPGSTFHFKDIVFRWVPQGRFTWLATFGFFSYRKSIYFAGHGVFTAIIGLALGYSKRFFSGRYRILKYIFPIFIYLWVIMDHACGNFCVVTYKNMHSVLGFLYWLSRAGRIIPKALFLLVVIAFFIDRRLIKQGLSNEDKIFFREEKYKNSFFRELFLLFKGLLKGPKYILKLNRFFVLRRQLAFAKLGSGSIDEINFLRKNIITSLKSIEKGK